MAGSIKTTQEIEIMAEGGSLLGRILEKVQEQTKIGVATQDLDQLAEKLILECGGQPSFKLPVSKEVWRRLLESNGEIRTRRCTPFSDLKKP